jgi:hypothetical protein
MKSFFLAAIAVISLGIGTASAATSQSDQAPQSQMQQTQQHRPNYYNFLEGGGG